jgi:hypothetical protein
MSWLWALAALLILIWKHVEDERVLLNRCRELKRQHTELRRILRQMPAPDTEAAP